jgi:hypothetical protein
MEFIGWSKCLFKKLGNELEKIMNPDKKTIEAF